MARVSAPLFNNVGVARLVLDHLTKDFRLPGGEHLRALDDLTLTVEPGEWLVLVGPSGCGKTTTLRLIAGLEEPTSGGIEVDGHSVSGIRPRDRDLAMVFQTPALYPHLSVFDNMAFGLRVRRVARTLLEERVRAAAEMLGLEGCLNRMPADLSGGQRQRVALGRALARRPGLLLLDEPLSNLDPQARGQLRAELLGLRERLATTAVYVTHDQHEAMTLATCLGVLNSGVLQQLGCPRDLYDHPANLFVAGFLGWPPMNFWHGTLIPLPSGLAFQPAAGVLGSLGVFSTRIGTRKQAAAASSPSPPQEERERRPFTGSRLMETKLPVPLVKSGTLARLEARVNRPTILGLRPEHVSLAGGADAQLQARVEAIEELGPEKYVHLTSGTARFVMRLPAADRVQLRDTVGLHLDTRMMHFFDPETEAALL